MIEYGIDTVRQTAAGGGAATFQKITITEGTLTSGEVMIDGTVTWNSLATTFTAWKINVTDTTSAAGSLLIDLQVGGASKFSVTKAGAGTFATTCTAAGYGLNSGGSFTAGNIARNASWGMFICGASGGTADLAIADSNVRVIQKFASSRTNPLTVLGGSTSYGSTGSTGQVTASSVGSITGDVNAMQLTIPAATISTDGDRIDFSFQGTYAANGNSKQFTITYGSTTLLDTGAVAINNGSFHVFGSIYRTGAATQRAICTIITGNALLVAKTTHTTPGETLSGATTLSLVHAVATANNDAVATAGSWDFYPAP